MSKAELTPQPSTTTAGKRKRSLNSEVAVSLLTAARQHPSPATTATTRHHQPSLRRQSSQSYDTSLVLVSRNFLKTSQLLLNEINSHKLAGIFAKPVSERDAPGHKDLILRPQDLKSIKAMISKGGKAAIAAMDAFEERSVSGNDDGEGPTSMREAPDAARERYLGNGVYLVNATDELLPPKGIVNSAQMEMELVRPFANAVMFNPLPSSERGFGPSLRLRKRGGDVAPPGRRGNNAEDGEGEHRDESSGSDRSTPSETGGIISDTREMFEDVLAMVRKWREVELEGHGNVGEHDLATSASVAGAAPLPARSMQPQSSTLGSGSANASRRHSASVEKEDESAGTPAASAVASGTTRKRRRIAEI